VPAKRRPATEMRYLKISAEAARAPPVE